MTIDERIEALTMHLELTAQMARDNEVKIDKMHGGMDKMNGRIDKLLVLVEKDAENIRGLARIAEIHEHRISGLEGAI
jgi:hypothetical protein